MSKAMRLVTLSLYLAMALFVAAPASSAPNITQATGGGGTWFEWTIQFDATTADSGAMAVTGTQCSVIVDHGGSGTVQLWQVENTGDAATSGSQVGSDHTASTSIPFTFSPGYRWVKARASVASSGTMMIIRCSNSQVSSGGGGVRGSGTVSEMDNLTNPSAGDLYQITDGDAVGDPCGPSGGGSTVALCQYDAGASDWVAAGTGSVSGLTNPLNADLNVSTYDIISPLDADIDLNPSGTGDVSVVSGNLVMNGGDISDVDVIDPDIVDNMYFVEEYASVQAAIDACEAATEPGGWVVLPNEVSIDMTGVTGAPIQFDGVDRGDTGLVGVCHLKGYGMPEVPTTTDSNPSASSVIRVTNWDEQTNDGDGESVIIKATVPMVMEGFGIEYNDSATPSPPIDATHMAIKIVDGVQSTIRDVVIRSSDNLDVGTSFEFEDSEKSTLINVHAIDTGIGLRLAAGTSTNNAITAFSSTFRGGDRGVLVDGGVSAAASGCGGEFTLIGGTVEGNATAGVELDSNSWCKLNIDGTHLENSAGSRSVLVEGGEARFRGVNVLFGGSPSYDFQRTTAISSTRFEQAYDTCYGCYFNNPSISTVGDTIWYDPGIDVVASDDQENITIVYGGSVIQGTAGTSECAEFDANGNLVGAGAACGVGGGGSGDITDIGITGGAFEQCTSGSCFDGTAGNGNNLISENDFVVRLDQDLDDANAQFLIQTGSLGVGLFSVEETGDVSCLVAGCSFSGTPAAATGDSLTLNEGSSNGTNTFALKNPDALTDNVQWLLPDFDDTSPPTAGQVLEIASVTTGDPDVITLEWDNDDTAAGGVAFSDLTTATNSTATMTVGTGASLTTSGSGTITATDVSCTGCLDATNLATNSVAGDEIAAEAVGESELGVGAVTNGKIGNLAVSKAKIQADAVGDDEIDYSELADIAVGGQVTVAVADVSDLDNDAASLSLPASTTISTFGATLTDDADASAGRTTLGVAIGSDVQAWDAELDTIAALTETNGAVIFAAGSAWTADTTPAIDISDATGSLDLGTGTIKGGVDTTFDTAANIGTLTADGVEGTWYGVTATGTITLPAISASGQSACFYAIGAITITIDPNTADGIRLDGTLGTDGVTIVSPGASGDFICLMSRDNGTTDEWIALGKSGTWTVGT